MAALSEGSKRQSFRCAHDRLSESGGSSPWNSSASAVWRRIDLQRVIAERFGIACHERTVGKLFDEALVREIDDEVQDHAVRIMQDHPKLVDTGKGKPGGDPFVVARALACTPPLVVVTQEAGGSADKPRIPFVCGQEGAATSIP